MLVSGRVNEKKHRGPLFLENMSHLKAWILMAKECCLVLANHHLMRMDLDLCPSDSIATGTAQNLWPGTLWWYLFLIGFFCILLECSGKNRFQVCVFIYTCIYIYIYISLFACSAAVQGQLWFRRIRREVKFSSQTCSKSLHKLTLERGVMR